MQDLCFPQTPSDSLVCTLPLQHGHPYISAMVSNGSFHYDHDRDGTHTALDGCEAKFRQAKHETFIAIRYERNRLMVSQQAL